MMPNVATACLLALLAAMAVTPAAAAARNPFSLDLCETHNRETCLEHPDDCTPCVAWGKFETCFETSIAKHLPSKLFTCEFAPSPDTDCGSLKDEASCAAEHCVWCLSAAVPSACYSEAEARRLPAGVFKCDLPSLSKQ